MNLVSTSRAIDDETFMPMLRLTIDFSIEDLQDSVALLSPQERHTILGEQLAAVIEQAIASMRERK